MSASPAFQFYPDDFVGSGKVGTMKVEEIGVYMLLLCLEWNEVGFAYDEEDLSRWCRVTRSTFRRIWPRVSRCFIERGGRMFSPRLDLERAKQAEWREKSRRGGLASADKRRRGGSTTPAATLEPEGRAKGNTPSPSPSPSPIGGSGTRFRVPAEGEERAPSPLSRDVMDAAYEHWVRRIGSVDYGHLRKVLLPLYQTGVGPIAHDLVNAVEVFAEGKSIEQAAFKGTWTVQKFAGNLHEYVRLGQMELQNEWGEPTDRGRHAGLNVFAA